MQSSLETLPKEVTHVTETLQNAGFEAYLVGGCVRDSIRGVMPKDWDITTNAKPEEVERLFEHTFYENDFGTVGVVNDGTTDSALKTIEVTTYRLETAYSNNRHPDEVTFSTKVEDDLQRRDFTMNAIAYDPTKEAFVDPYNGQKDIKDKVIKAVGDARERFNEDALRIMRAVRLATEIDFQVSPETEKAIQTLAPNLKTIAIERIRDEFTRIIMSNNPMSGIQLLQKLGILQYFLPELERARGVEQDKSHIYNVYEHLLHSVQHAADKKYPLHVRLAALFHDISKPETRRITGQGYTFYGHEVVGSRVTAKIMDRLRFPVKLAEDVVKLVRWHMFFSDTEEITLSAVRRMMKNVGEERVDDLITVRICDRIGSGRPKEEPYRLRKYQSMIDEVRRDPISVGMLKIDGAKIMEVTQETPGPKIGYILYALLEEVLEEPKKNTSEYLEGRAQELITLSISELAELGKKGKESGEAEEKKELKTLRRARGVR